MAPAEQNGAMEPPPAADGGGRKWASQDPLSNMANILTVVLTLVAIGLSIWEGYQNRQFHRLTVLPHLEPAAATADSPTPIENEYFLVPASMDSLYAVGHALENSGLGPAALQNVLVYRDSTKIFDSAQSGGAPYFFSHVEADLEQLPFPAWIRNYAYSAGGLLQADEIHHFFTVIIPYEGVDEDTLDREPLEIVMDEVLEAYGFAFCYCSVYGMDCGMAYVGAEPPVEDVCNF